MLYNFLQYVTLKIYDPATSTTLLNIKVFFTGVLVQMFFGKKLTKMQWFALCVLLMGCIVAQSKGELNISSYIGLLFIVIQAFCSSLGGVYFQWTLQKREVVEFGIWEKNIYLYFWGVVMNVLYCSIMAREVLTWEHTLKYDKFTVLMVLSNSLAGFSTSFLLKYLDAVMKEYANAFAMIATAICQSIFLGLPFYFSLIVGIIMISVSLSIYQSQERKPDYKEIPTQNEDEPKV